MYVNHAGLGSLDSQKNVVPRHKNRKMVFYKPKNATNYVNKFLFVHENQTRFQLTACVPKATEKIGMYNKNHYVRDPDARTSFI